MTNCVQLLQHVDLLHADGGLGFQKEFDYIQAATVEKKGSYDQGCISCGILVSGIRARGASSEHMEMFSCSPT